MRTLGAHGSLDGLSSETFSVLQHCAINRPLFPNLKTVRLWNIVGEFIPLFLSPGTVGITISFDERSRYPTATVASIIDTLPALCPNLQDITFYSLPGDPIITAAVSGMLLASNRNVLRSIKVDSPLEEGAREVIYKLPNLRTLSVVIKGGKSSPTVVLPNLTDLTIKYDHDGDWSKWFRGATLGKLETVSFYPGSERIGNFLDEFERVALATHTQNTLSDFRLYTSCPWNPNYSSLLPFTQLTSLLIESHCENGCSSAVDDDVITTLARTMPKLEFLWLGDQPCSEIPTGLTAKGLAVLAHHCPGLSTLCVHFHVASLNDPPAVGGVVPNARSAILQSGCTLTDLEVGEIPMLEEAVPTVALTLALIFPHIETVDYIDENWKKVLDAICLSREIINRSSKEHSSLHLESALVIPLQELPSRAAVNRQTILHDFTPAIPVPHSCCLAEVVISTSFESVLSASLN